MKEIGKNVLDFDTVCATFHIDKLPDSISLTQLPHDIIDWIELNGFDFYMLCTPSGRIESVSSSIEKNLSYLPGDLIGKSIIDFFPPNHKRLVIRDFNQETSNIQKFTVSMRNNNENYIWFDLSVASIYISSTKEIMNFILAKDITDKKEAEEMLIRSEKMSVAGQLAAGVAHEIRNPLTSLKGFIQLLQAGIERKEAYYSIMVDEIEKIDTITSELLFISKPMTDNKKLEAITPMLHEVVTLLNTQAKRKNIEIELIVTKELAILCDRSQIKQVFINLIKNAIEAMSKDGSIIIEVLSSEEHCYIKIIDQGPGIPRHLIHKINEPFFTTKKDGTGLGLMISNKIIKNHEGTIDIQTIKGNGSVFSICLPLPNQN
ncbi:ATP-binding protein [Paraliobacillus salinarum]|uniref:ATP-binding protein n=1 Tax=Paraliobacillus salinarum TaxID=1158996 RepID=UPI0015F62EB8|nr:ATP-binding protein [Paraliobacillus salinarum]